MKPQTIIVKKKSTGCGGCLLFGVGILAIGCWILWKVVAEVNDTPIPPPEERVAPAPAVALGHNWDAMDVRGDVQGGLRRTAVFACIPADAFDEAVLRRISKQIGEKYAEKSDVVLIGLWRAGMKTNAPAAFYAEYRDGVIAAVEKPDAGTP